MTPNESTNSEDIDLDVESLDLDDLLPAIGEFGKYQQYLLWFICLPACIPCGFGAFNQLFMTDIPHDYWCAIPELSNMSIEERKRIGIPFYQTSEKVEYDKCLRYVANWTHLKDISNCIDFNLSSPVERCIDGWEFNTSIIASSIVIDFDLICGRDIYPTIGLAALNAGGPFGVYLFGLLNDRKGRRISYFSCLFTLLIGNFLTALSTNFWMWTMSRVVVGLTIPAVYQIPFILALELVGPNYRSFVTVMTCTFYTFGIMMLSGIAYLVRDWIHMTLWTSVPFLSYFLYAFIMPESPRWLLANQKLEDGLKMLENMANVNKKTFPERYRWELKKKVEQNKFKSRKRTKSFGAMDLCKTPNMRLKTILITLNWFANETVYLGLSYYGPSLGESTYVSFFLSSLVEIPSYLCCWIIMDKWGRRLPLCLLMIMSGITCIITVSLPADAIYETLLLFLLSKALISASFLIIYPFAGELYPTQVRGVGIGTSSYIGGIGLIIIPFITYLGTTHLRLPLVVMGSISIIGGLTGLRLPETLHNRLPQTLEEGEEFGKYWNLADCFKFKPQRFNHELTTPFAAKCDDEQISFTNKRRATMKKLVRQSSTTDTQKNSDGDIQLTYWF